MHLPDGIISTPLWGGADLFSGVWFFVALRKVSRELEDRTIPRMGVLAAFVFAIQMMNLPIGGGTSAHFVGGALLALLLGPWAGFVMMCVVLVVQCLWLQDGGLTVLGVNMLTMGFLGTFVTGMIARRLTALPLFWRGCVCGWFSVVLSAVACASFLSLSKVLSWTVGLSVIGGIHVLFGLAEGLVTGTLLQALKRTRPDLLQ